MKTTVPSTTRVSTGPPCPRDHLLHPIHTHPCGLKPCSFYPVMASVRPTFPFSPADEEPAPSVPTCLGFWGFSDHWCVLMYIFSSSLGRRDWIHSVPWTEEKTQLASFFEEICPITPNPFPLMPENLKLVILENTSTLLLWVLHMHTELTWDQLHL